MDTLHILMVILATMELGLLAFGDLQGFDYWFLYGVLAAQATTAYGLWSQNETLLRATHFVFGASLTTCALFAQSLALIVFLVLALGICIYAHIREGDCSYHKHTKEWECTPEDWYLGAFTAPMVYGTPVAILVIRAIVRYARTTTCMSVPGIEPGISCV